VAKGKVNRHTNSYAVAKEDTFCSIFNVCYADIILESLAGVWEECLYACSCQLKTPEKCKVRLFCVEVLYCFMTVLYLKLKVTV
jgi:hypothetical protein